LLISNGARPQGARNEPEGILPVARSGRDFIFPSDYRYRVLAGNGEDVSSIFCGGWMSRGCLSSEKHSRLGESGIGQLTIDGCKASSVDVIEFYKMSCGRLSCPTCYEKACGKLALKIEHRFNSFKLKGRVLKAIHVVVSPPEDALYFGFSKFRKAAYDMAMRCGVHGGCIIFHPFRRYNENDLKEDVAQGASWKEAPASWYLSPHFHIIGYGWVKHTKEMYEATGWIVRNLGVRESVRSTALYQLSHCGVNKGFHSVVWFGSLSYSRLKGVMRLPAEKHECSSCGGEMKPVVIISKYRRWLDIVLSDLEKEGHYFVQHGKFRYKSLSERYGGDYG